MQLAIVLLGSALTLLGVLITLGIRVEVDARAQGQPNGDWGAAFGFSLGPLALTGVTARHARLRLEVHALGRRFDLWRGGRGDRPQPTAESDPSGEAAELKRKASKASKASKDPLQWLDLAFGMRKHLRLDRLEVALGYGFRDVALTGKVLGAVCMLAALLPRSVRLEQHPRWHGEESWEMSLSGRLSLWPGLVLARLLWYMLRRQLGGMSARPRRALRSAQGSA